MKNFTRVGTEFNAEQRAAQLLAEQEGIAFIEGAGFTDSRDVLGTRKQMTEVASFQHAYGTFIGQWGLPAEHTMYAVDYVDTGGEPLDGSKFDYTMTFEAPDVDGFWSYTVYNADTLLMEKNDINRHSRGDRTLTPNPDGTYTIALSTEVAGKEGDANFLPIPNGPWYSILSMYTPGDDVRNDVWQAATFDKVKK